MGEPTDLDHEDRLRVCRKEAARLLSISLRQLDYRIAGREIQIVHDGRSVLILMSELRRYARANHYTSPRLRKQK